jgi:hypothetical protein
MVLPDDEERLLMQNLGRLREGEALRQWIGKRLISVLSQSADIRALSIEHGRRLLCAELIQAIEIPDGGSLIPDDLVRAVHRPREPVPYGTGSRRRVPDVSPDDASAAAERKRRPRRREGPRADRRLVEPPDAWRGAPE